jgi:ribonuclease D
MIFMEHSAEKTGGKATAESPYSISTDGINLLPLAGFRGRITVVSTVQKADWAAGILQRSHVLGFDTETRPSFRRGERPPVALVQISTRDHAFLFRVNRMGMPASLKGLLEDGRVLKVGQGLKYEMQMLKKDFRVDGRGFIDLLEVGHRLNFSPKSVKGMSALFLGIRISKAAQTTNWESEYLSEKQIRYAATDAWACLMIYDEIRRRNLVHFEPGKLR